MKSVLKSAYLGVAAGGATVLLAMATTWIVELEGVETGTLLLGMISFISMGIVIHLFVWRIHTDLSRPVFSRDRVGWAVPIVMFIIVQPVLSWLVFVPMGEAGKWPQILSITGLFAAALISAVAWETERAKKDAGE